MKKISFLLFFIPFLFSLQSFGQDTVSQATVNSKHARQPNRIKSGFYIKLGPSFPMNTFSLEQSFMVDVPNEDHTSVTPTKFIYYAAKLGFAMDMGFLVYIGPAFANNHLRAGIDATFVSFSFNPIKSDSLPSDHSKSNYWYYYIGQKFGPVLSICPIDRLVIDLSYKMNAYAAYNQHKKGTEFKSDYGKNLTQNEISMNIRYSIILFSFQYNFGKTGFNNFSSDNPMVYVDNNTFRILVGFKF